MSNSTTDNPAMHPDSASGGRVRRRTGRLWFAVVLFLAAVAAAAAVKLAHDRARAESLAFAAKAREANERGDHAVALLWALMGLPQKGELIGPQSHEASVELLRAYGNNRLLQVLKGPASHVDTVSFSPDGKSVLTVSYGSGTAGLRDVATGKRRLVLDDPPVTRAQFHPGGGRVVIAFRDGSAQIRDLETGSVRISMKAHAEPVDYMGFNPDGTRLFTAAENVKLWDAESGTLLHTLEAPQGEDEGTTSHLVSYLVAFSPDGKRLVTGLSDGSLIIWNVERGEPQVHLFRHDHDQQEFIGEVVFSPSGEQVAAAVWNGTAYVWEAATGREVCALEGHAGDVEAVAFSPAGGLLVTAAEDHLVRFWDPESCRPVRTLAGRPTKAPRMNKSVSQLTNPVAVFSPDGARLVTTVGASAQLWDVKSGGRLETFGGHEGEVNSMAFSPDGARLVTGSWDEVRLWTVRPPGLITMLEGHDPAQFTFVDHLAFDRAGRRLATTPGDETVRLWDARTGKLERLLRHESSVDYMAFDRAGTRMIAAAGYQAVVWDVQTGRRLAALKGEKYRLERAILNDAGTGALAYIFRNSVSLWDVETGRRLSSFSVGPMSQSGAVLDVAFTPEGPRVLTRKRLDEEIDSRLPGLQVTEGILWNAETGEPVLTLKKPGAWHVTGAFSRQGTHLVTSLITVDGVYTATIREAGSGAPVMTLTADWWFSEFLEFDWANRRLIALHGPDVGIWDLESGTRRQLLSGDYNIVAAAFAGSPDLVFTAAQGGGALLWDLPSGRVLKDFSDREIRAHYGAINSQGSRIAAIWYNNQVALSEVSPIYRADPREQVRMACAMAARTGAAEFSESDRQSPLLRGRPENPCDRPGLLSARYYRKIADGWFGRSAESTQPEESADEESR